MTVSSYADNIKYVFSLATPEEVTEGLSWYHKACHEAQLMADTYELPLHIVVGVLAALSPTNKWERNLKDTSKMLKVFTKGGYVDDTSPSTYKTMRDKAWSILEKNPRTDEEVSRILKGPKITDFFKCIMGENVCVIDGHAWCIANYDRRTLQEVPHVGKKLRENLQEAYRLVAEREDLLAYEVQAITWLAWKRIHKV